MRLLSAVHELAAEHLARRDAVRDSTRGDAEAAVSGLVQPRVKSPRVFVGYGPQTPDVRALIERFVTDLRHQFEHPPSKFGHLGTIQLWHRGDGLASAGGPVSEQLEKAAAASEVGALVLGRPWLADEACQRAQRAFERAGRLDHRRLVKVRLGHDEDIGADPRWETAHPIGSSDNLLSIYSEGTEADRQRLVSAVGKDVYEALDALSRQGPADLRRTTAALGFHDELVRNRGEQAPHAAEREDAEATEILPVLEKWVCEDGSEHRVTALLGSFGAGKTTTCQCLARTLVDRADEAGAPLPVYLDLRRLVGLYDGKSEARLPLTELVIQSLRPEMAGRIDGEKLLEDIRVERSVVIFDGLDEVATSGRRPSSDSSSRSCPPRLGGVTRRRERRTGAPARPGSSYRVEPTSFATTSPSRPPSQGATASRARYRRAG